jgi:hypothetical protein
VLELSKQHLFKYEDFNSSLKQKNIFKEEYNTYRELSQDINHLQYLEWYNTQDMLIICWIIDFLFKKFAEYDDISTDYS